MIESDSKLRFIGTLSTGYNTVDLDAASERKIPVSNIPNYSTQAVAQLTMALLLEICHHVGAHSEQVLQGKWSECPDFCFWSYPTMELTGKTIGIIGFGSIGQAVARLAEAFGMNVVAYGHRGIPKERLFGNVRAVSLEELYETSDIISLHCPLTKENQKKRIGEKIESIFAVCAQESIYQQSQRDLETAKTRMDQLLQQRMPLSTGLSQKFSMKFQ